MINRLVVDKSTTGAFFEDFAVGQRIAHPVPRTVTEGDAALYLALTGDRHPLYCDREFARALGYEREPVNDLLTFHIVFGKSVPDVSLNAVANLGYAGVRFLRPVYAGDTLRAESEVVGKKENSSGRNGNVYVHTKGLNQRRECVLEFFRWVMVRKRDLNAPSDKAVIPDLPKSVAPDELVVDAELDVSRFDAAVTGGGAFFEDYAAGERIHHHAGMATEEAEHAMATRLYQNTAKVHFDAHAVERRIVYGGHVISVARALAFKGLENALRILAWNGGTHANPTHAGDTIYAMTEVVDTAATPGRDDVAALRLRLLATRDFNPSGEEFEVKLHDPAKGREVYHPNVVLDLDYWVLMPKRAAR